MSVYGKITLVCLVLALGNLAQGNWKWALGNLAGLAVVLLVVASVKGRRS